MKRVENVLWSSFFAFVFPFLSMLLFHLPAGPAAIAALVIAFLIGPFWGFIFRVLIPYSRKFAFVVAAPLQIGSLLLMGVLSFYIAVWIINALAAHRPLFEARAFTNAAHIMVDPDLVLPYMFYLATLTVWTIGGQIIRKIGPSEVWHWVTGRYHRPREETRIFMFLDVKDSTPLAEHLGNLKFSELMQAFFRDMSLSLAQCGGAVSHFIGDEAVIYWPPHRGVKNLNCVRFFFDLQDAIQRNSANYLKQFGVVPKFKAGLHIGTVVAAEVGTNKSEISLYGDAVNTTARIVGKCAELNKDLLISEELVEALGAGHSPFAFDSLGPCQLKGKSEPLTLFGVGKSVE